MERQGGEKRRREEMERQEVERRDGERRRGEEIGQQRGERGDIRPHRVVLPMYR